MSSLGKNKVFELKQQAQKINLHHDLMFFITFILFFVLVVLVRTLYFFQENSSSANTGKNVVHGTVLEIV
jgi:heme/copper-type cytochrome/quinol oxidase subunit 2